MRVDAVRRPGAGSRPGATPTGRPPGDLDRLLAAEPDLTPYEVAGAVSRGLPPRGLLFVGASNPIRDLDLMVAPYDVGGRRKVIANRGLAGIDGTTSSAIGAALGRPQSTRALALMGDVTFLHDTTGLVLGPREARPDLTIVVVNDDGGSIFATLEQGAPEYADRFDTLFGTPHGVDVASLCAAARIPHLQVTSLPELEQALASPNGGHRGRRGTSTPRQPRGPRQTNPRADPPLSQGAGQRADRVELVLPVLAEVRRPGSPRRAPSRRTCAAGASCPTSPAPRSRRRAGSG